MLPEDQSTTENTKDLIQQTVGVYPLTPLSVSFFHHHNVERIICKKDGLSYENLKQSPLLKINESETIKEYSIENHFNNGLLESLETKTLPAVIFCTPSYNHINDFLDEITEVALNLMKKNLLKGHTSLKKFYFPTFIIISNGIVYDEITYNLKAKLIESEISELIATNITNKIIRASVVQEVYKENDVYFTDQNDSLKLALPRFPLFSQVVDILNNNNFSFSVNTNPHRVEFEKAIINIAINSTALAFALDKTNCKLRTLTIKGALSPINHAQIDFTNKIQKAIFEIGKKAGAFPEAETFDKTWPHRKEQIIQEKGYQICSSLHNFKNMIKNNTLPEKVFSSEYGLIYPLKCYAQHYELFDEVLLFEELEKMLSNNLEFAHKNANKIIFTF